MLNRDEICLIFLKLDLYSRINFSMVNKRINRICGAWFSKLKEYKDCLEIKRQYSDEESEYESQYSDESE